LIFSRLHALCPRRYSSLKKNKYIRRSYGRI
jgi:hypothetical protein